MILKERFKNERGNREDGWRNKEGNKNDEEEYLNGIRM